MTSALLQIEQIYNFGLILAHPDYQYSELSDPDYFLSTGLSQVRPEHELTLLTIEHHSPLAFLALVPALAAGAGALWVLAQTFEKIANFPLNRRKLRAEVELSEAEARRVETKSETKIVKIGPNM